MSICSNEVDLMCKCISCSQIASLFQTIKKVSGYIFLACETRTLKSC